MSCKCINGNVKKRPETVQILKEQGAFHPIHFLVHYLSFIQLKRTRHPQKCHTGLDGLKTNARLRAIYADSGPELQRFSSL